MLMRKLAKAVSIALGLPWIMILTGVIFMNSNVGKNQIIPLALTSLAFHILVPLGYLFWGIKTGKIDDFDITKRKQRYGVLAVTITLFVVSLIIVGIIGNTTIFHMLAIILTYLTIVFVITFFWKISLHMGVNVLSVIFVSYFYHWNVPYLFMAIPLIFWSRYTLKKHTPAQLTLGAIVSATIALGGLKFFGYI